MSDLTLDKQEAFLDQLESLQDLPTEAELAFFADRRLRGVGVGMDLEGRLELGPPLGTARVPSIGHVATTTWPKPGRRFKPSSVRERAHRAA